MKQWKIVDSISVSQFPRNLACSKFWWRHV